MVEENVLDEDSTRKTSFNPLVYRRKKQVIFEQ